MDDEGDAERLPGFADEFGAVGGRGRRECGAVNVGKARAGFFKDAALGEDTGASATALGARPVVLGEAGGSVLGLKFAADAVLQREQVGFDGGKVDGGGHG